MRGLVTTRPLARLCVCVRIVIKLHITTQSGPAILVIPRHSHWSSQGGIKDTSYVCLCARAFINLHITPCVRLAGGGYRVGWFLAVVGTRRGRTYPITPEDVEVQVDQSRTEVNSVDQKTRSESRSDQGILPAIQADLALTG